MNVPLLDPAPDLAWERYCSNLRDVVHGNAAELLIDGGPTFAAMLAEIEAAQESVCLETYIYEPDFIGERFAQALIRAAMRGVHCALLIDGVGAGWLPAQFIARLRRHGVLVMIFRPISSRAPIRFAIHRDHRKVLVVDGRVAFVGGINIHAAAAARADGGEGWHDFALRLRGPVVGKLRRVFDESWNARLLKPGPEIGGPSPRRPVKAAGGLAMRVIATDQIRGRWSIRRALRYAIKHAIHSITIANAYFVPDAGLVRQLRNAAERGVKVSLLLPARSDIPIVDVAGGATFERLLSSGVEIHQWTPSVLHAKVAVVDDTWSMVGSYNLDWFSLLRNREVVVTVMDTAFGRALAAVLAGDIAASTQVTTAGWAARPAWRRYLAEPIAHRFRRYM